MSRLIDAITRLKNAGKSLTSLDVEEIDTSNAPWNRAGAGRLTAPEQPRHQDAPAIFNSGRAYDYSGGEFRSLGEFAKLVSIASDPQPGARAAKAAERLRNAALTTYGSEGVGADGGFAVPPEFRAQILEKVYGEESLLGRCDLVPINSGSVTVPKDETSPWGASGIQGYWDGEAATMTQRKPVLESATVKLHKLTALVPVTDELLEDAPALAGHIAKKAAEAIDFKLTDAIVNGTGVGQPLGILNAAHTVDVAKETSQVAATIHGLNLVKMWARMPAAWRKSAVWLAHPDTEPQLMSAALQVGPAAAGSATGGSLIYMPAGTVANVPYATLFGRPIVPSQACAALGTRGDLIFASLGQYALFERAEGLRSEASIHMWFDQGVTAFRFTLRIGGQPWWSTPISDKNGSSTRSAFVTLATRS